MSNKWDAKKMNDLYNKNICKTKIDEYINANYKDFIYDQPLEVYNVCPKQKFIVQNTYWNNPIETEQQRVARVITTTLGGKTTFGNNNIAQPLNYLGKMYGMPGGSGAPPRNQF